MFHLLSSIFFIRLRLLLPCIIMHIQPCSTHRRLDMDIIFSDHSSSKRQVILGVHIHANHISEPLGFLFSLQPILPIRAIFEVYHIPRMTSAHHGSVVSIIIRSR
ncbi:uncharacterized protein EDB93DRAFT_1163272 [Suillus bovinus]|uniref:uncharacterized protein n=1 Tax=Suillus bovinus TaxID=48563 RepID=UPI001B8631A2|nr:uncharacterized protein EDB93DRAFT_1163272 [Suillus bovinus]KAG2139607.1 hypothetical protein EDB93DRAFT_1163272 [Suillus bovinus]